MIAWLKRRLCWHPEVEVIRFHRNVVPSAWRGKLLYVDRHDVHCFVRCTCCKAVLHTRQTTKIFEQKEFPW